MNWSYQPGIRGAGFKLRMLRALGLVLVTFLTAGCAGTAPLHLAAGENNDLVGALRSSGIEFVLHETALDAVENAPDGAGVLLLADGYPEKTLDIGGDVIEKSIEKDLRVYLEYPGSVGGQDLPEPTKDRLLRCAVASEFFGPDLPRSRILSLNGMHVVSFREDSRSHLRGGRIAGFDRAVFGIPNNSIPLLLEPSPGWGFFQENEGPKGRILVSATGLSRFISARYGPEKDWAVVWQKILEWTAGSDLPGLQWTPAVRPTWARSVTLPEEAETEGFRRGLEWFAKSRMIVSESMLEESRNRDDFLLPWEESWPEGDGSSGSLEAVMSVVYADGEQPLGTVRRGDCIAETAMAIAAGAEALSRDDYAEISRNLLDFYLLESPAAKNERADPRHGAFGLIAWGISSDAWYKANYGDDNARVILAALAASSLLDEDRWNDVIMRCLVANLRTTGQKGFRTSRIDIKPLEENGWKYYFEQSPVHPAPHFEAYLWACYLLAYEKTGYDLFLERAESAIRITMEAYPDNLRWTNGLAQEMARMILPLAWLVRVEDTREHRDMLDRAIAPLLELQDECGAIRELLGNPENGKYPPPRSNEEYGTNEASLIAENGDRVSDLLYTVNFAFLGLHEAAAVTGDPVLKEAGDRLADFLVRIQIKTDRYPYLDGGWFRAFDFERWEFFASNADAGWGAWCIESGWTQGWITAVLGFRHMDTSLWELAIEPEIEKNFPLMKESMMPGL